MNLNHKKIGIFGLSPRTGLELIKYLSQFELQITAADAKNKEQLKELLKKIKSFNLDKITFDLGSDGARLLETDLIILSPGVPYDLEILKKARQLGIETISEIEFAFRESEAKIIAVTGTNGKTTTSELLAEMLADFENKQIKAAGNIGIPFISIIDELEPQEPVVLELSSFQLEAVKEFKAEIALYLNYSPDHLDRHQTEKNYKRAKKNIFLNQTEADYALLNFDDPYLFKLQDELKAQVLGIARKNKRADLIINQNQAVYQKENLKLLDFSRIDLPGQHNRENMAFAALAAYLIGQKPEKIQQAAENYRLKPHRMEFIENKRNYTIINDSKSTNPDSAIKAVESIKEDLILIAGGQDRNADFSGFIKTVEKKVKTLILIGETAAQIAALAAELEDEGLEIIRAESIEKAAAAALKRLNQDKVLLLSPGCPSWDMFRSYKERGSLFKKTVLEKINQ